MQNILVCFVCIIVIVVVTFPLKILTRILTSKKHFDGPIYCIMVTGKDSDRIRLARKAIKNFLEQTYQNKVLVIVNHHESESVINQESLQNVFEFHVSKEGHTLGDLRNIALQLVAHNACWTTWDDDDYRHPQYLEVLSTYKTDNNVVAISNRLEYNSNNKTSWVGFKRNGFVFFLASFDNRVQYLSKDTMEDVNILIDFENLGYTIKVIDNDPKLYVRIVHANNTSLYVKPTRDYLVRSSQYSERFTNKTEYNYINTILQNVL